METIAKLMIDYGFENFDEVIETLKTGERENKENNIFFENAIEVVKGIYSNSIYQSKLLREAKEYLHSSFRF